MLLLLLPGVVFAQTGDIPITIDLIGVGETVQDTITEAAIYDWWVYNAQPGDRLQVRMTGTEGLAPLVGLLAPSQEMVARSVDGEPDGTVEMTYTVERSGEFIIVATRAGNATGTSVGAYTLSLNATRIQPTPAPNPYRTVLLTCDGEDTPNVLTFALDEDSDQTQAIVISAYGLDGFLPALHTQAILEIAPFFDENCYSYTFGEGEAFGDGDRLQLPGEEPIIIENQASRVSLIGDRQAGQITFNLGAVEGAGGRYVIVIEGLRIGEGGDRDLLEIGLGPLAREGSVRVYAVSDKISRLDTQVERLDATGNTLELCDDAGRRACAEVPSIDGFELVNTQFEQQVIGGMFDGGLLLAPGSPDALRVAFGGFDGRTYGGYSIVIIGAYGGRGIANDSP